MRRTRAVVPLIALVAPLVVVAGGAIPAGAATTCDGKGRDRCVAGERVRECERRR